MAEYLFAYGTLRPGLAPPQIAGVAATLRPVDQGFIYGELIQLNGYPGAVPDQRSKNKIIGTILELPDDKSILRQLDEYEGCDPHAPQRSEFVRTKQTVQLDSGGSMDCWIYRYSGGLAD